jgi:hypothetical protein
VQKYTYNINPFKKAVILVSLLLVFTACTNEKGKLWAEVNNIQLYEYDAEAMMVAQQLSPENEAHVMGFIDSWIEQQLVNAESKKENPTNFRLNEIKAEQTLYQLNLFELENEFIRNNLDSTVTTAEIMDYYRKNRDNYLEQSFIVKALYIKIPDSIGATKNIEKAFLLKNDKDRQEILKYANLYATNFYFEEEKWIFFEDLVRDIPITDGTKERLIVKKDHGIFTDKDNVYFLNILDYRIKNTTAPLEVEKETIRKIILKRRSNELRKKMNQIIIDEIKSKHTVNRYH